ncbi:MAG: tetratricopeptide repeat protein [bacterium]
MTQFYAGTTSYMPSSYQGGTKLAQQEQDNSQHQSAQKTPHDLNISQILVDFKNTIASIGAPAELERTVNEYLSLIEVESNKETPRKESIITNLKTASKMLDEYISQTLKKPSNVVQDWMDAFLLQQIDYKADASKAVVSASKQIESGIEQTNPQIKHNEGSAVSNYNNYQNQINLKHRHVQNNSASAQNQQVQPQAPQSQEQVEEQPKKALKFATADGKIIQGDKVIGEKKEDGTTKMYSAEEVAQKTMEAKTEPKVVYVEVSPQQLQKANEKPKEDAISKTPMIQNFYEKAKEYFKKGDSEKALESYKKTLNYAKKAKDKTAQAYIIQGIGESYDELNNLPRAAKCFNRVVKTTKDTGLKAIGHNSLGEVYDEAGKFDLAMDHYFESLALNGEEDNTSKQAKTLNSIGKMHTGRYMSKESIEFYKLALTMAKQNNPDIATMGSVLTNTATSFEMMNKPQSALKYYQKSLICANKANDKETASQAYEKAADLMMNMNRPQKAQSLYRKAMQEALNIKDTEQIRNIKEKMNSLAA